VPPRCTSTFTRSRSPLAHPSSFPAIAAEHPTADHGRRYRAFVALNLAIAMTFACGEACSQPTAIPPVAGDAVSAPFAAFVAEASQRFGIPAAWIRAVMRAESFGNVHATSPRGAIGLMQIMPDTWAGLRLRYKLGVNPYDAHDNIMAGAAYLRELHDRYGISGFLAAYNAGPARWEDHVATGRPLPAETRAYLVRLTPIVGGGAADDTIILAAVVKSWTEASLFPPHPASPASNAQPTPTSPSSKPSTSRPVQDWTALAPQPNGLFVALSSRERSQ
jgi:soluble lytic murein transglycosylase-like protein